MFSRFSNTNARRRRKHLQHFCDELYSFVYIFLPLVLTTSFLFNEIDCTLVSNDCLEKPAGWRSINSYILSLVNQICQIVQRKSKKRSSYPKDFLIGGFITTPHCWYPNFCSSPLSVCSLSNIASCN